MTFEMKRVCFSVENSSINRTACLKLLALLENQYQRKQTGNLNTSQCTKSDYLQSYHQGKAKEISNRKHPFTKNTGNENDIANPSLTNMLETVQSLPILICLKTDWAASNSTWDANLLPANFGDNEKAPINEDTLDLETTRSPASPKTDIVPYSEDTKMYLISVDTDQ